MSRMNSFLNDDRYAKLIGMYPELKYPIEDVDIARFAARVERISPVVKYVAKSEKIAVLEREREQCVRLMEQCKKAMDELGLYFRREKVYTQRKSANIEDDIRTDAGKFAGGIKNMLSQNQTVLAPLFQNYLRKMAEIDDMFLRDLSKEKKGLAGESAVESAIKQLGNQVILLSNLVLKDTNAGPDDAETAETDALVLTPDRIWVCEIKNYGRDGDVVYLYEELVEVCDRNGCLLKTHASPFIQNSRHKRVVSQVLIDAGYEDIKISPVVIIANPNVTVINKTDFYVVTPDQFAELVSVYEPVYSRTQQLQMADTLAGSALPDRRFPVPTLTEAVNDPGSLLDNLIALRKKEADWEISVADTLNAAILQAKKKLPWEDRHPWFLIAMFAVIGLISMIVCSYVSIFVPEESQELWMDIGGFLFGTFAFALILSAFASIGPYYLKENYLWPRNKKMPFLLSILFDQKVMAVLVMVLSGLAAADDIGGQLSVGPFLFFIFRIFFILIPILPFVVAGGFLIYCLVQKDK